MSSDHAIVIKTFRFEDQEIKQNTTVLIILGQEEDLNVLKTQLRKFASRLKYSHSLSVLVFIFADESSHGGILEQKHLYIWSS